MKFYIGQIVICKDDTFKHGTKYLKKGNKYVINDIKENPCCNLLLLDVGIIHTSDKNVECMCNKVSFEKQGTNFYVNSSRFSPLEELQEVTFSQIKEEINIPQSIN